eukprot:11164440-Lingulodinium_polyedra.AAC.1
MHAVPPVLKMNTLSMPHSSGRELRALPRCPAPSLTRRRPVVPTAAGGCKEYGSVGSQHVPAHIGHTSVH